MNYSQKVKGWPCRQLYESYSLRNEIGHGSYGSVYRALRLEDGCYCALKKMEHMEDKNQLGFPITTIRQIKLLQKLQHQNILNIGQVVYEKSSFKNKKPPNIYLCLDLMQFDLNKLIKNVQYQFSLFKIQLILKQLLNGLNYLHQKQIAHRDIKPSNLLLNNQNCLKIADFGLAKKLDKLSTVKVVTLWYRAPQILLGIKNYTTNIDIWSVGCVLAEIIARKPLFFNEKTQSQIIERMFQLVGTPNMCGFEEAVNNLPIYNELRPEYSNSSSIVYYIKKNYPQYNGQDLLLDLLEKMLRLNPNRRFTAKQCLQHDFFTLKFTFENLLPNSNIPEESEVNEIETLQKKIKY